MICKKCGKENTDNSKFCLSCGTPINEGQDKSPLKGNIFTDRFKITLLVSVILSGIVIILPFCTWVNVPIANSIYSLFGGNENISNYSLFSYTIAGNTYGNSFSGILYIVLLLAIIAMILNLIYIIKIILNKKHYLKFCMFGSILMLISSLVFWSIMGLSSAITANLINVTATPVIAVLINIANIVLVFIISSLRKKKEQI